MASGTREEIRLGQLAVRFLVEGKDSAGSIATFEFDVPPEPKSPSPTVTTPTRRPSTASRASSPSPSKPPNPPKDAPSKSAPATPSASLDIPLGAVHRFDNLHPTTSRTLAIITPGILTPDYFREVAAIARAAATSTPPTPPDPKAIGEVMRRHGLTPAP